MAKTWEGSISTGTLRPEDLIPRFIEVATELQETRSLEPGADRPERVRRWGEIDSQLGDLERRCDVPGYFDSDGAADDLEYLFDLLNELAPDGLTFGAHHGDGADFGFWASEDSE